MAMTPAELNEERRRGRIAAVATFGAAGLMAVGIVWAGAVNRDRPDKSDAARIRFFDDHAAGLIAASAIRALGFLLLIFAIVHLHRATKARNPELSPVSLVVGVFGAVAIAFGSVGQAVALADKAADFVTQSYPSPHAAEKAADDAAKSTGPLVTSVIAFAGTIALAFWFVLDSLNAMRAGLLTRFIGVLGIIVGTGFIFGFAPPLMVFWLIAVGLLFLGYWPRGMPPAWETGEARPWPGREAPEESRSEQLEAAPESPDGEVNAVGPGVRTAGSGEQPDAPGGPARRKRKRKR
jgi:uncharacterized protein DUF4386